MFKYIENMFTGWIADGIDDDPDAEATSPTNSEGAKEKVKSKKSKKKQTKEKLKKQENREKSIASGKFGEVFKGQNEHEAKIVEMDSDVESQDDHDDLKTSAKASDSNDFIPSKKFTNSKPGYVFFKGPKGLGYYVDPIAPNPNDHNSNNNNDNNDNDNDNNDQNNDHDNSNDDDSTDASTSKNPISDLGAFAGFNKGWMGGKSTPTHQNEQRVEAEKPRSPPSKTKLKQRKRDVEWVMPGMSDTALLKSSYKREPSSSPSPHTSQPPSPTPTAKVVVHGPVVIPSSFHAESVTLSAGVRASWAYKGGSDSAKAKFIVQLQQLQKQSSEPIESDWSDVYSGPSRTCTIANDVLAPVRECVLRVKAISGSGEHSEWTTCDPFFALQSARDNAGGYGPYTLYSWEQGLEEIDINIRLDPTHKYFGRDFTIKFLPTSFSVKRNLDNVMIIDGPLHDAVEPEDCFWELETDKKTQKLMIQLRKRAPAHAMLGLTSPSQYWPRVVQGHPQIDADQFKKSLPDAVTQADGKPMKQKKPYGREAERAGFSPYGMDANASPDIPYDGYGQRNTA